MIPLSDPVLTPLGWDYAKNIEVGNSLIGRRGRPVRVVRVTPGEEISVAYPFQVTLSDGSWCRTSMHHPWLVRDGGPDGAAGHCATSMLVTPEDADATADTDEAVPPDYVPTLDTGGNGMKPGPWLAVRSVHRTDVSAYSVSIKVSRHDEDGGASYGLFTVRNNILIPGDRDDDLP